MKYINVVVDNKSKYTDGFYTYKAEESISIGDLVVLPFGTSNKEKTGIVCGYTDTIDFDEDKIKTILDIKEKSFLSEEIVKTALWMKQRYGIKYYDALRCFIANGKPPKEGKEKEPYKSIKGNYKKPEKLTDEQQLALDAISKAIESEKQENFLIHGVTSSGKTQVYMEAIEKTLAQGKTAIMLQMAKAAAIAGKAVNLFNLEMTNTELAQRMIFSTGKVTPLQMARGEVIWTDFEVASGQFASKPIYLNDSATTADEIISRITLNSQAGKCDIAFIDYLGLIQMGTKAPLHQAIAETTKRLKQTAKACRVPIVLLCQLNRASASEKRAPMLYDLRDSGSIEQDADIVLMLERASDNEDARDVNMWVRKNRQGKAGEIKIEIEGNETFTAFRDKNEPPPPPLPEWDSNFENDNLPF